MKLYIKVWGYPAEPCHSALEDLCLREADSPYTVTGMPGVLQYVDQLFNAGINVMLLHHQDDPNALWLCVDSRQFQSR